MIALFISALTAARAVLPKQASSFLLGNATTPTNFNAVLMYEEYQTDKSISGKTAFVDPFFLTVAVAIPYDTTLTAPCDVRTIWTVDASTTTAQKWIAWVSVIYLLVCVDEDQNLGAEWTGKWLCRMESAGFLGRLVLTDQAVQFFAFIMPHPQFSPDCPYTNIPTYIVGFVEPAFWNGPLVLGALITNILAGDVVQMNLTSGYSDILEVMNLPVCQAFYYISVVVNICEMLYATFIFYKLKSKALSYAGFAIFMEGYAAATLRCVKAFFEPLFYSPSSNLVFGGTLYYTDTMLSHAANVVIMLLFAQLVVTATISPKLTSYSWYKPVFFVVVLGIVAGFVIPPTVVIFEALLIFDGAYTDIPKFLANSATASQQFADNQVVVRNLNLGMVSAVSGIMFFCALVLILKLFVVSKAGSVALLNQAKLMLKFIVFQILFFAMQLPSLRLDGDTLIFLNEDTGPPLTAVYILRSITGWALAFLQLASLYSYHKSGGDSSSSS